MCQLQGPKERVHSVGVLVSVGSGQIMGHGIRTSMHLCIPILALQVKVKTWPAHCGLGCRRTPSQPRLASDSCTGPANPGPRQRRAAPEGMQRHKPTHQPKSALPRGTGACGGGSGDSQGLVWAGQGGTLSARPDRSHCCHPQGRPALLTCTPQAASSFSIAASCLTASPRCSASTTVAGWLQGRPSTTPVPPPLWLPAPPPLPAQDQDSQAFQAIDTPLLNATRQSVGTKRKLTRCAIGQTCGAWGQAAGVGSGRAAGVGSGSGHQHVGATLPLGTRARLREAQLTAATPQSSPRTTMAAHSRHACQMQVPTPARESHTRLTHHQIASVDPPDLLLDGGQDQLGVPLQGLQQCKENAGLQQHDSSTTSAPAAWHQRQESQRVSMSSRHQQPASAESIGSKATSLAAGLAGGRGGAECGLVCMAGTACRWRPAQLSSPAQPSPAQLQPGSSALTMGSAHTVWSRKVLVSTARGPRGLSGSMCLSSSLYLVLE